MRETIGYPNGILSTSLDNISKLVEKWSGNKKMANNAQVSESSAQGLNMTPQQIEHLLKLIPHVEGMKMKGSEMDEEIDYSFSGMVCTGQDKAVKIMEWILGCV